MLRVPNAVLREMYETNSSVTSDGRTIALESVVTPAFANALYDMVRAERPSLVLEIGLAQGATALSIATALAENGSGRLISIDPFQNAHWQGVGLTSLARAGLGHLHSHVEAFDYVALPNLLQELGATVDFAYIDGLHSYEYVLLDFFYVDRMLKPRGVVGFNDCDWPAVIPTLRFVEQHRHYSALVTGLEPAYGTRNDLVRSLLRAEAKLLPAAARMSQVRGVARLLGRRREDRYFRKIDSWEPEEGWMSRG